jgi:hypothetical protein
MCIIDFYIFDFGKVLEFKVITIQVQITNIELLTGESLVRMYLNVSILYIHVHINCINLFLSLY